MKNKISKYSVLLIGIIWLSVLGIDGKWKNGGFIYSDVLNYYSYLPAFIVHQDVSFSYRHTKEINSKEDVVLGNQMSNGYFIPKMSMGIAFMMLPFFVVGHIFTIIFNYEANGFSFFYSLLVAIGHFVYAFLAIIYLRKVLLKYFSDKITAVTILVLSLSTNLIYYASVDIGMTHSYSFFLFVIFIYYTIKWHEEGGIKNSILVGLVVGLSTLVRPTNIIIVLFFIFYNVKSMPTIKEKIQLIFSKKIYVLLIIFFSILMVFPQLLYWKLASDSWIYYSYGEEGFFFNNPQIINGFFSYRKGWLLYTPIMSFSLLGFFFLYKNYLRVFWPIIIFFTLNVYIVFSWWCWWYGAGFGLRAMVESYAFLSIPLAAFLNWAFKLKQLKYLFLIIILFFTSLNLVQAIQVKYCLHYDSMTKEAYWKIFFARNKFKWPDGYAKLLQKPDYKNAIKGQQETFINTPPKITLEEQISRIKGNKEWYEDIQKQAKERGIPVDSMLVRSANYMLNQKNEK